MAARLRKTHQDDVRKKIQASQLINVLQNHALGVTEELPQTRIKAIEILLRKAIPDLSQIDGTLAGEDGGPIEHRHVHLSAEEAYKLMINGNS